jgi:hypothetical protein
MSVDGGVSELGQFQIITINRGSRDGIEVGHVLASFRRGTPLSARPVSRFAWNDPSTWFAGEPRATLIPRAHQEGADKSSAPVFDDALVLPDERNGLIFVFRVFEKMSYGMVMRASRPIYVGDSVQTP